MNLEIAQTDLERLSIAGLRDKFEKVLGYASGSRSRAFLIRKILWGVQAKLQGDISEKAHQQALAMADDRDLKARYQEGKRTSRFPDKQAVLSAQDSRLPVPGSVLERNYRGRAIHVLVLETGFEFEGKQFPSLSAIAREVTGTRWNGFGFFGLLKSK